MDNLPHRARSRRGDHRHPRQPAVLKAVLARIEELGIERINCGGDLVGYGPHPNEVCGLIQERGIPTIYGNYDYAIGRDLEDCGCAYVDPHDRELGQRSVAWTLEHTDSASKEFMRELPFDLRFELGARVCGWSTARRARSTSTCSRTSRRASTSAWPPQADCDVLVFGHTHKPWIHEHGGVLFVNCGSVGKPKDGDPRAAFVVSPESRTTWLRWSSASSTPSTRSHARSPPRACPRNTPASSFARRSGRSRHAVAPGAGRGLRAFALVFAGCGAIVADARYDRRLGMVGVALAFGLVIMVLVYATGHVSGAHINPAVTIAFTLTRHFPAREAAVYVGAQLAGATAGAALLRAVWTDAPGHLGATVPSVGAGSAALYELVLTALLMFVIVAVATDARAVGAAAAIAIGGTVGLDALFGGAVTGASMNPARSFGPALLTGTWTNFWVYVAGPVAGAALGGLAYQLVRGDGAAQQSSAQSSVPVGPR